MLKEHINFSPEHSQMDKSMNKQGRDVFGLRRDDYRYGRIINAGSPEYRPGCHYERRKTMRLMLFVIH